MQRYRTSGGVGFCGLLTIVFITLRLLKVIDWSWVWVLAPLWGGIVLGIAFFVLVFVLGILAGFIELIWRRIKRPW